MQSCGNAAASTALPQPPRTSQRVPRNSAARRLVKGIFFSVIDVGPGTSRGAARDEQSLPGAACSFVADAVDGSRVDGPSVVGRQGAQGALDGVEQLRAVDGLSQVGARAVAQRACAALGRIVAC